MKTLYLISSHFQMSTALLSHHDISVGADCAPSFPAKATNTLESSIVYLLHLTY